MSFSEAAVIRRSRFQDALRSTTADAVEGGLTVAGFVVAIVATLVLGFRGNPDLVTIAVVWLQSVLLWRPGGISVAAGSAWCGSSGSCCRIG